MRRLIVEEPLSRAAVWSGRTAAFATATAIVSIGIARFGGGDPTGALAVFGASLALLAYPAYLTLKAISLPILNDITTDFETPPTFMISAKAREARAGRVPPSRDTASEAVQKAAYPDIQPMMVDLEAVQAYQMALRIAKELGWRIVDANPPNLRGDGVAHIDATDRSRVFAFVDDIAIRIRPLANQTRIDIRSVSRIGKHDFGANARRIRKFIAAVQESVQAR